MSLTMTALLLLAVTVVRGSNEFGRECFQHLRVHLGRYEHIFRPRGDVTWHIHMNVFRCTHHSQVAWTAWPFQFATLNVYARLHVCSVVKFLEENKAKEGVITLPSGFQYKVSTA